MQGFDFEKKFEIGEKNCKKIFVLEIKMRQHFKIEKNVGFQSKIISLFKIKFLLFKNISFVQIKMFLLKKG